MIPVFAVVMDNLAPHNPISRIEFRVEGLPRDEAIKLATDYSLKTGFLYTVAYVLAGHKQED